MRKVSPDDAETSAASLTSGRTARHFRAFDRTPSPQDPAATNRRSTGIREPQETHSRRPFRSLTSARRTSPPPGSPLVTNNRVLVLLEEHGAPAHALC